MVVFSPCRRSCTRTWRRSSCPTRRSTRTCGGSPRCCRPCTRSSTTTGSRTPGRRRESHPRELVSFFFDLPISDAKKPRDFFHLGRETNISTVKERKKVSRICFFLFYVSDSLCIQLSPRRDTCFFYGADMCFYVHLLPFTCTC